MSGVIGSMPGMGGVIFPSHRLRGRHDMTLMPVMCGVIIHCIYGMIHRTVFVMVIRIWLGSSFLGLGMLGMLMHSVSVVFVHMTSGLTGIYRNASSNLKYDCTIQKLIKVYMGLTIWYSEFPLDRI